MLSSLIASDNLQKTYADTLIATVPVGREPVYSVFDSANGDIYVGNLINDNTVSVIDGSTNTVVATIPVGTAPRGIAFDSANGNVYVSNVGDNTVSVISTFTIVHNADPAVLASITAPVNPIK